MKNLLTNSKLPAETWLRYCGCFANLYYLRKCARICDVSLNTSFFMRRRILEILFTQLPAFRAEAGMDIQVDEIYIRDSYKGPDRDGRLPRRARRRGKGSGPGLNKELVCVMTGVNDAGDMFFDIAGRGKLSLDRARSVIENRLCSGVIVTTDNEQSYRSVLRNMGCDHRPHDDREHGHLSGMDSHHSRIRGFPRRFNGVSTRWLEQYLG